MQRWRRRDASSKLVRRISEKGWLEIRAGEKETEKIKDIARDGLARITETQTRTPVRVRLLVRARVRVRACGYCIRILIVPGL